MTLKGKIYLKKGRDQSVLRNHPWIFSGAIQKQTEALQNGDWVEVCNYAGEPLCYGHYQVGSISVRVLHFSQQPPTDNFWIDKLSVAFQLRQASGLPSSSTNAYRLIHAEGDGLPGLIIDLYNGVAVVQAHSFGMHTDSQAIVKALQAALGDECRAIYYKSRSTLPGKAKNHQTDGYLVGYSPSPHTITEHSCEFFVDWEAGQKTGFFLDQRENRKLLIDFCNGKSVLNTFCYTGGFSVYALKGGATCVHSIDASEKAIEMAKKNIELNGFASEKNPCIVADTFDYLDREASTFDVLVLDPPAFAKHRDARHQAVKGYQRLNASAIRKIKPGGIVFTFSCSQVVNSQLFYDTIVSAALQAGREVKVLHRLTQPADHPVSMFHPEGEYLKGLVLYVC